jgi:hypothetical protein
MEKHLGADLSSVRIHTSGESAEAARNFGARAFTVGSDVHFGHGEFDPGSKEGDRLLAHELTHVVQGQKTGIQRKADEKKDAEGGEQGPEVSKPGDSAEVEADAMGDHVAKQEHEGGEAEGKDKKKDKKKDKDKKGKKPGAKGDAAAGGGGGEHEAHEHEGEEKKEPGAEGGEGGDAGEKKEAGKEAAPPIAAKLEGVGRKVFLAAKPGAAPAAPGPAGQPPKGQNPAAPPAKSPEEAAAEKKCKDAVTAITVEANNPDLPSRLKYWADQLKPIRDKFPQNAELKNTDTSMTAKQGEVDKLCTTTMQANAAKIDKLPKAPESWAADMALFGDLESQRWMGHYPDSPAVKAFREAHDKKQNELKEERTRVCKDAKEKIMSAPPAADPAKPAEDPRGKVDAAFEHARPWLGKNIFDNSSETALQDAYTTKIEQIAAAKAKAAQEAAEKEKEKKDKDKGGEKKDAKAGAPAANAAAPPAAHPAEQHAAPQPAQTPPAAAAGPPTAAPAHGEAHAPAAQPAAAAAPAAAGPQPVAPANPTGAPVGDPAKDAQKAAEQKELEAKKEELKTRLVLAQSKTSALMGGGSAAITILGALHVTLAAAGVPGVIVACGVKVGLAVAKFMKQKDTKLAVAEIDKIESIAEIETMLSVAADMDNEIKALKNMLLEHKKEREAEEEIAKLQGKQQPAAGGDKARGQQQKPSMGEKVMHGAGKVVGVADKVEPGADAVGAGTETALHVGHEGIKEGAKHVMEALVKGIEEATVVISLGATAYELVELKHAAHEHHEAAEKLEKIEEEKKQAAGGGAAAQPAAGGKK